MYKLSCNSKGVKTDFDNKHVHGDWNIQDGRYKYDKTSYSKHLWSFKNPWNDRDNKQENNPLFGFSLMKRISATYLF